MSNPKSYTVGWICAITTEYVAAQAFLDNEHRRPKELSPRDNNDYVLGDIHGHNVVIAVLPDGEYGTSSAATVARDMLHSFPNIRISLMVGIGGGVPNQKSDIRLGDIVVSSSLGGAQSVFQYDFGRTVQGESFYTTGYLSEPPTILRTAVSGLKAQYERRGHQLEEAIQNVLDKNKRMRRKYKRPDLDSDRLYHSQVLHPRDKEAGCEECCGNDPRKLVIRSERTEDDDRPMVHYGCIASGNQLMKDALVRDKLAAENGVLCFEMEAAGLMNHFPCLVIRGICDYADSHKNKAWQGYAAMAAAAYAKDLLYRIVPLQVEGERCIWDILSLIGEELNEVRKSIESTDSNVKKIRQHGDDQERQTIIDWLTPLNYAPQQNDLIALQQEGSGQWLLKSAEFNSWLEQANQTLYCPGIPGAGKTIITSIVIRHLFNKFGHDPSVGIAYLYCNFWQRNEQKAADFIPSLVKQLVQQQPTIHEDVKNLYYHHRANQTRPSLEEILSVLHHVASSYSRTFIIIDALDECQGSYESRGQFLQQVFNVQLKTKLNIFATSRFIQEIERHFHHSIRLEIRASDEDVQRYIDARLQYFPSFVIKSAALVADIRSKVTKAVDGMFLLAQLYVDSLACKTTPKAVRLVLEELQIMPVPSNDGNIFKALDRAYMQAMERILAQWPEHRDLAIQTLSWICCAKRRLTSLELQHAIAVEINQSKLDSENITSIELIASVCAGLIRVDEESGTIGLVHYTAQEYFERNWKTWLPNAHTDLTKACLSYLSFEAFKTGSCPTQYHFERRLKSHPFYSYAASNWGYHARESSVEGGDMILNLLENPSKVSACSQAMRTWRDWLPARVETGMTGLHLAAYFGLWKSTSALLERFRQVNAEDRYGRTPLSLAAENGHEAVVKLLLENNANIESQSIKYGLVPLSWAAKNGHKAVVKLLLENNADIEAKDFEYGLTPLLWAAKNGYEEVVKLLLDKNADIESEDLKYGLTPLSWAAENGHEAVVKLLLKSNANIESRDHEYGQTPLLWAAENGHEAVVELLLERSANTESKDHEYSQTPLLWAAKNGHEAVVKLLLGNNADVESKDYDYGQTPLSWAARDGHEAVVKLLLQRNAHIESKDHKYGQTPLSWAAKNGHEAVVKLLLESNANIESKDEDGQTPLSQAAENGHEAVVKLLHESNADIEPKRSFTGQVDQRLTGRCLLLNHEKVRLESKEQSYAGCSTQQNHLNHHVRSHKEKPQVCWVPGCHRAFLRTDNLNAHYVKHHSKRGGRNHYVSTLDENSREFNPDFRGPLRPDGHPFHWSKLVDPDTSSSQDLERFPMYDEWE